MAENKTKGSTLGKDPAVSFFFNDWNGGTMTFSRHLKGCYIDLLTAQFNNGHLSLSAIKVVLNGDFEQAWSELSVKFKQDKDGNFFNERLDNEITKRLNYSKSRSKNKKGKSKSYDNHMGIGIGKGIGYRIFKHLVLSEAEFQKILDLGYSKEQIDTILDAIENYRGNTKYTSLYLTALNWLKKEAKTPLGKMDTFLDNYEKAKEL